MANVKKLMLTPPGSGDSYWIMKFMPSAGTPFIHRSVRSSDGTDDGNLYWYAGGVVSPTYGHYIAKLDKDANISLLTFWPDYYWGSIEVDSEENVYLAHSTFSLNSRYENTVIKFNSNLEYVDEAIYTTNRTESQPPAISIYNDDVYLADSYPDFYPTRSTAGIIDGATLSSSGWYSYLGFDGEPARALTHDSTGNIYLAMSMRDSGGSDEAGFMKFTTNFSSVSYVRRIETQSGHPFDIQTSGTDVYVCGRYENNEAPLYRSNNFVSKFNSAGTEQWTTSLLLAGGERFNGGDSQTSCVSVQPTANGVVSVHYGYENVVSNYNDINIALMSDSDGSFTEAYGIACSTTSPGWKDPQQRYGTHHFTTDTAVYIPARDQANNIYLMKLPIQDASSIYGSYTLDGVNFTIGATNITQATFNGTWGNFGSGTTARTFTDNFSTLATQTTPTFTTSILDL